MSKQKTRANTKTDTDKGTAVITAEKKADNESKSLTLPFSCVRCGGSSSQVVGPLPSTEYDGETPSGFKYALVTRSRVRCNGCGQHGITISYTRAK